MLIKPVATEKSLGLAKNGKYTFWVNTDMDKTAIKKVVSNFFGVDVIGVRTVNFKSGRRRSMSGKFQNIKARKKAIVTLKSGQTIDLFETEKKTKSKKKTATKKK